jgi:predicted RNA-binding protein YlxR (DUF448 family)
VLTRVVRRADGTLAFDRTGPGRGAWICRDSAECLEVAIRRHAFDKAFSTQISAEALRGLPVSAETASKLPAPDVRG